MKNIALYILPIGNRKLSLVNFTLKWIHVTRLGRLNYCIIIITDVHISLHAIRKCIVIALPKSLVMSFVLLNLFGLYSMFCPFSFNLISLPLFFQKTVTRIYHIFLCERVCCTCSCRQLHTTLIYYYYAKSAIRLFHGTFFNCVLYVQSFFFITSHWIPKWWRVFRYVSCNHQAY